MGFAQPRESLELWKETFVCGASAKSSGNVETSKCQLGKDSSMASTFITSDGLYHRETKEQTSDNARVKVLEMFKDAKYEITAGQFKVSNHWCE